jgi:hypothetical protein
MKQKVFTPSYKVSRHGNGLYSVYMSGYNPIYITRVEHGSRNLYHVNSKCPLFPTLRDAVMHIVFGG